MDEYLIRKIFSKIEKKPTDYQPYEDSFSLCRAEIAENKKEALRYSTELRSICEKGIRNLSGDIIPQLPAIFWQVIKRNQLYDMTETNIIKIAVAN